MGSPSATVNIDADTVESCNEANTVPLDAETVATPHRIILQYPHNTPRQLSDKFPQAKVIKHAGQRVLIERSANADILLNEQHMPKKYLELWCEVSENGPKFFVKNHSNKKKIRILINNRKNSLTENGTQEIVDKCELRLEMLQFIVSIEQGDTDCTGYELEVRPLEEDESAFYRQNSSSSSSGHSEITGISGPNSSLNRSVIYCPSSAGLIPVMLPPQHSSSRPGNTVDNPAVFSVQNMQLSSGSLPACSNCCQPSHVAHNFSPGQMAVYPRAYGHYSSGSTSSLGGSTCSPAYNHYSPGSSSSQGGMHSQVYGLGQSPAFVTEGAGTGYRFHYPQSSVTFGAPRSYNSQNRNATIAQNGVDSRAPSHSVSSVPGDLSDLNSQFSNEVFAFPEMGMFDTAASGSANRWYQSPVVPQNILHHPHSGFPDHQSDRLRGPLSMPVKPKFIAVEQSGFMEQSADGNRLPSTIHRNATESNSPGNLNLPFAPPISQLDALKRPVEAAVPFPVQIATPSPVDSLQHSSPESSTLISFDRPTFMHPVSNMFASSEVINSAETPRADNPRNRVIEGTDTHSFPYIQSVHAGGVTGNGHIQEPSTINVGAASSIQQTHLPGQPYGAVGYQPQSKHNSGSSTAFEIAANGNTVHFRSASNIATTPPPSSDFSTLSSFHMHDLSSNRLQPQEDDERGPEEHTDEQVFTDRHEQNDDLYSSS